MSKFLPEDANNHNIDDIGAMTICVPSYFLSRWTNGQSDSSIITIPFYIMEGRNRDWSCLIKFLSM